MVMLHVKLKVLPNAATYKHIFCPQPLGGVNGQNIFPEVVMLHIKLMGMEYRAPCKHIFCPYIHPRPLECDQKSKHFFNESSQRHVAYQSKGNKT